MMVCNAKAFLKIQAMGIKPLMATVQVNALQVIFPCFGKNMVQKGRSMAFAAVAFQRIKIININAATPVQHGIVPIAANGNSSSIFLSKQHFIRFVQHKKHQVQVTIYR